MSKGKIIGKSIQEMIDEIRKARGSYEAKRLERAADEVPNLERLYQREALEGLFRGDNAKGIMTMRPGDFERYAAPLDYRPKEPKTFIFGELSGSKGQVPEGITQEEYLRYLANLGGFETVPYLEVNAVKQPRKKPEIEITGHEGRHRSRALEMSGQPSGLVEFIPRASLREPFPRRSREEYIQALNEEMSRYANMVRPQQEGPKRRPLVKLPDVYKQGGPVQKSAGGRMAKSIGAMAAELSKKRAVLPKEEAEANLRKMLESSKVQQRLYHGTTATEGGKGQEAIRRFKPSKEGALGSGSYLTPAPSYASGYADQAGGNVLPVYAQIKNPLVIEGKGDPMIEALIKLGMDEDKASRMVERAYENKGYIGKEVESRARAAGYDGLMQYRDGELSEVVSYNPNAIKSAIGNVGTYDTSVPDLSKAKGGPVHKQDGGSIKASPAKPGQQFLGRLGQVAEKLGIKLEEAMKIVAQEGNSPVKAFLVNMLGSETLKSAGTALQDWTGTPRDATEDYPYRRLVTGKGMTAQFDPRLLDVAPIAGTAASRVAGAMKNLPTDVMRAATAAYGPRATASPMDVWHGSPHRFPPTEKNPLGQFDPTKIGTGEGAQAYGHGHYFAESPKVAKGYVPRDPDYEDKLMQMYKQAERKQDYESLAVLEDALIHRTPEELRELHPEHGALIDKIASIPQKGSLYKVDLPDEQIPKMLDWDKPLHEQTPEVQMALRNAGVNILSKPKSSMVKNYDLREIVREALRIDKPENVALIVDNERALYEKALKAAKKMGVDIDEAEVGEFIKKEAENYLKGLSEFYGQTGEKAYKGLMQNPNSMVEASESLRKAGIPGIKYFDAASRDAGEGTRNFVVFPGGEEMLTIKERMKKGGAVGMQAGGIARRLSKYAKGFEPSKKTEIFIGEKSPMWNASAAGEAVKMEKSGADPVDIWKQTGTFRSPDGALRQEISDVGSKFRGEKEMKELAASMKQQEADIKAAIAESKLHPDLFPKQLTAAQKQARQQAKDIKARRTMEGGPEYRVSRGNRAEFALEHPELYEAYPLLSGMDVQQGGRSGSALGSYIRGINESDPGMVNIYDRGLANDPRSTMIHEAQHAIQNIEGWGRGGNPITAFQNPEAFDILNKMRKQLLEPLTYEEYVKGSGLDSLSPDEAMSRYEAYKKGIPDAAKKMDVELQRQAAKLYYDRLAGEAEARAAQARIDLTPRQRLENFPLETGTQYGYDVKPEDIIVKREKKGGQVSIDAMRLAVGGLAEDEERSSLDVSLHPKLMKELIDLDRKAKADEFVRKNGMQEMPRRSGLRLTPDMIEFDKNIKGFAGRATYDIPVGKYGNISPYVGGFVVKPKGMDAMGRLTNAGITYTDRFKDGGKVRKPVSIDAMRLAVQNKAKGGAATSNEAMLRRAKRLGKVDKPVSIPPLQLARGWAAGTAGLPGDIESLVRVLVPGMNEETFLPTSEDLLKKIPGAATDEVGQRAAEIGTLFGGAGTALGGKLAAKGARAIAPKIGETAEEYMFRAGMALPAVPPSRSIEEATKLFEAAKKTRSKAAQEAAGLYHPIGGGIKLSKPIELMRFETVKDPTVKGVPRKIITLEDLQNGIGIPLVGDRAAGGTLLTSVEGIPFRDPLTLEAGPDYMLTHTIPGSPESSIWRSGKNVITGLQKQVEFARDTGRPIYGVNVVGAPTNVNYNTMVTEAILNQYDPTALTKKAKKEFLKDIRNYAPDASKPHLKPGAVLTEDDMNDVEALRAKMLADGAGPLRKAFVERMALEPFQKMGFPDVPASRLATTEPLLVDVPTGSAGFTVGTIDPAARALENTPRGHKTYPIALAGEYFGSLGQPIDYRDIFQEFADKRRLLGKPEASDWRSFSLAPQFQTFDQEWLDRIMKSIGATNPREWKKGGAVNKAAGGMASIPQKIMRAFVEAGKKAKLQEKAKEAIAKGETYIPDEETTRIQRELLQGVKKPEELAEGGQITSDDLILEERPL